MISEEPPFRSLPRDERRERIVWAAKLVMLEKGLDASSMDDVAARAGTTKPTVYAHFKSKEELFSAVVELIKGGSAASCGARTSTPPSRSRRSPSSAAGSWSWRAGATPSAISASPWPPPPAPRRSPGRSTTPCYAEARRSLAAYLRARGLTAAPRGTPSSSCRRRPGGR